MKAIRKYDNQINKAPDTGALLKAFFRKRRISKAALARTLNRASNTLVGFVKRNSIQTAVLWEICHALKHNFFADIAAQLPATYTTTMPADNTQTERITQMEHENALLQAKYEALVDVMRK